MISRVLVPVDDSEMAMRALTHALEVYPDADITVLHVVGEPSPMMGKMASIAIEDDIEEIGKEEAADIFERARSLAADHDVEIETDVGYGSPAREIVDRADQFDILVIGSHGGTLADQLFVGNVAKTVVRRSPIAVTIVR